MPKLAQNRRSEVWHRKAQSGQWLGVNFPEEAKEIINHVAYRQDGDKRIGSQRIKYEAGEYENDVERLLDSLFPFSRLSGVRLFSPANRLEKDLGFEMDNLLHIRHAGTDHIVVIEAKKQKIVQEDGKWTVTYEDRSKCAREQIENHVRILWEYLEPISKDIDLKFTAIVCSLDAPKPQKATGYRGSKLFLLQFEKLPDLLDDLFSFSGKRGGVGHSGSVSDELPAEVLRVTQSNFLNALRLSLPVPDLGHPELASAIRYVERCRRSLDESLFQDWKPTAGRWAINGSAGMGKSVLLAYAGAVLCSGYELSEFQGVIWPIKADKTFESIRFSIDKKGGPVCIMAMSAKQLENLRSWYSFFTERFLLLDKEGDVRFRQPEFHLCGDAATVAAVTKKCSALLVDEAHDLPLFAAKEISTTHSERGYYLAVACDRHQKLRLAGSDAKIIEGLDFSLKSRRLNQIYRNPVSVYLVSLALMFRWGAEEGPKVIPTNSELSGSFGFEVNSLGSNGTWLEIMSDAHPANSWCHTVATFPSTEAAYLALSSERMGHREVLWVRFSEEDPTFDYEKLREFTYHNCRSRDAHKISDKYVKGQEYPIVVIEGFPGFMDRYDNTVGEGGDDEARMWAFRREVYLCASRATCFLYFICNPLRDTEENIRIRKEIKNLVDAVALPREINTGGTKCWRILIRPTTDQRRLDVFDDAEIATPESDETSAHPDVPKAEPLILKKRESRLPTIAELLKTPPDAATVEKRPKERTVLKFPTTSPVEVKALAKALELKPFQIIGELIEMEIFASLSQHIPFEVAKALAAKHDIELEAEEPGKGNVASTVDPKLKFVSPQAKVPSLVESAGKERLTLGNDRPEVSNKSAFKHRILIPGPISVVELARHLGVQHREVIYEASRMKILALGGTVLDLDVIERIAAKKGFGIDVAG